MQNLYFCLFVTNKILLDRFKNLFHYNNLILFLCNIVYIMSRRSHLVLFPFPPFSL
uniref:Uncharacterized protein n=1 Tax=Papilio xuthus TaxID=66420 RepID=I4DQM0_PAPXU|nr:unknown unsecreted protein [Papilio xuthus]